MKKFSLLLFAGLLLISCKGFFYGYAHNTKKVQDNMAYWDGIPSYQVNTKDRYCFAYGGREHNFKGTKYDMEKANKRVVSFLRKRGG